VSLRQWFLLLPPMFESPGALTSAPVRLLIKSAGALFLRLVVHGELTHDSMAGRGCSKSSENYRATVDIGEPVIA
jgi:hypothetical protein